jgi:hypothetical protein
MGFRTLGSGRDGVRYNGRFESLRRYVHTLQYGVTHNLLTREVLLSLRLF